MSDIGDAQQLLCTMISSDTVHDQRPTDEPAVIQLSQFMLQKEIYVTRYGKIDHSRTVVISEYGVQYPTQVLFFNSFSCHIMKE